jgi:hypothetical protein
MESSEASRARCRALWEDSLLRGDRHAQVLSSPVLSPPSSLLTMGLGGYLSSAALLIWAQVVCGARSDMARVVWDGRGPRRPRFYRHSGLRRKQHSRAQTAGPTKCGLPLGLLASTNGHGPLPCPWATANGPKLALWRSEMRSTVGGGIRHGWHDAGSL